VPAIETICCSTARQFLAEISPRSETFTRANHSDWLFRGQAVATWDLKPTAFRDQTRLVYFASHVGDNWHEWTNRDQIAAEADTLIAFADEADRAGLPVPGDLRSLYSQLRGFLSPSHMPDEADGQLAWPPSSTWPIVALAQHHGLATRFLDWSRSPYVAAYFAAIDVVRGDRTGEMAVWAFSTTMWHIRHDYKTLDRYPVIVTAPYASNPNLRAQRGVHLSVPLGLALGEPARREDFAELLAEVDAWVRPHGYAGLKKFTLDSSHARNLLWFLAKEGVTAAQLFPGYSGAAQGAFERQWQVPE